MVKTDGRPTIAWAEPPAEPTLDADTFGRFLNESQYPEEVLDKVVEYFGLDA